jgi:hypothetical protein
MQPNPVALFTVIENLDKHDLHRCHDADDAAARATYDSFHKAADSRSMTRMEASQEPWAPRATTRQQPRQQSGLAPASFASMVVVPTAHSNCLEAVQEAKLAYKKCDPALSWCLMCRPCSDHQRPQQK